MSVILVGAGPGSLGEKVAEQLDGWPRYIIDRNIPDASDRVQHGDGNIFYHESDARSYQFYDDLKLLLYKRQPELVINFVGAIDFQLLKDLEIVRFNSVINTNLWPLTYCAKALADYEGSTCFIQIGSNAASYPFTGMFSYSVAKAAQKQMIKIMAKELAPRTRCNIINPGPFEPDLSNMSQNQIPLIFGAEMPVDEAVEKMKVRIPMKRLCRIDDLVSSILFIKNNSFMTGQSIELSGGQIL